MQMNMTTLVLRSLCEDITSAGWLMFLYVSCHTMLPLCFKGNNCPTKFLAQLKLVVCVCVCVFSNTKGKVRCNSVNPVDSKHFPQYNIQISKNLVKKIQSEIS